AVTPPGAEVAPATPAATAAPPSELSAAVTPPPEAPAAPPPEAPVAMAPPPEAPAADPAGATAVVEPTGSSTATEATGPASDATTSGASASTGDGKPRSLAMPRTRARRAGRLELAIHGSRSYLVVVDGVAQGARSELVLAPGPHAIEVRAAGEL